MGLSVILAEPYPYSGAIGKISLPFCFLSFSLFFSLDPEAKKSIVKWSVVLSVVIALLSVSQGLGLFHRYFPGLNRFIYPLPGNGNLFLAVGFTRHHTTFAFSQIFLFHLLLANALFPQKAKHRGV
jgi:hypothetical protein